MPTNFAPPVNVSPLIKFCRWSFLLLGIGYGSFWQGYYTRKELGLKDIKAKEKAERDARLAQEKALRNADSDFCLTKREVQKEEICFSKTDGLIIVDSRGTRVTIAGLTGDEKVSIIEPGEHGVKEGVIIEEKEGKRITVESMMEDLVTEEVIPPPNDGTSKPPVDVVQPKPYPEVDDVDNIPPPSDGVVAEPSDDISKLSDAGIAKPSADNVEKYSTDDFEIFFDDNDSGPCTDDISEVKEPLITDIPKIYDEDSSNACDCSSLSDCEKDDNFEGSVLPKSRKFSKKPVVDNVNCKPSDLSRIINAENSDLNRYKYSQEDDDLLTFLIQTEDLNEDSIRNSNFSKGTDFEDKVDKFITTSQRDCENRSSDEIDYAFSIFDKSQKYNPSFPCTDVAQNSHLDLSERVHNIEDYVPIEVHKETQFNKQIKNGFDESITFNYLMTFLNEFMDNKITNFIKQGNVIRFFKLEKVSEPSQQVEPEELKMKEEDEFFLSGFFSI